ncbi:keratin, type II cytoskeletal 2 epidermal [Anopheles funestus]|uniref:keratin, type II cytoskeletal 2 epidermal n=1 Tax=Anopheles funestus TaxID=62324 RepID=UPI0020C7238D|nr:keratin, type II cytoskeletal 2 epidermal [Anopheles funestus]
MSGKSVMNKFVIRNIAQRLVHCMYVCVFYLILLCMLDTAGIGADKMPQEDISVVTEVDELSPDGSSSAPTEGKGLLSSDIGFVHAFAASFMVIIVSELGDKTFFIAAIMAMRHPRLTVFAGAIAALALMTVLSVLFGMAATLIPRIYTFYISTALFALFGFKMLYDGYHMSATGAAEELEEVQSDLRKREDELARSMSGSRKETVELVPLSDTEDQRTKHSGILPRRHGPNNGSIHSLAEQQQNHTTSSGATLRLSASAAQLTTSGSTGSTRLPEGFQQQTPVSRSKSGISTDNGANAAISTVDTGHGHIAANGGVVGEEAGGGGGGGGGGGDESSAPNGGGTVLESSRSKLLLLDGGGERGEQRQRLRSAASSIHANGSVHLTAGGVQDPHPSNITSVVTGSTANGPANQHKMHERETNAGGSLMGQDAESGGSTSRRGTARGRNNSALKMLLRIFIQAFTMTFVAEWGDRSQLTTVILSARENVWGVIAGGIIGHSICTGLAVIGGRMVAQRISVRTVTLIGGVVFLLFALSALLFGPGEEEPIKVPIP